MSNMIQKSLLITILCGLMIQLVDCFIHIPIPLRKEMAIKLHRSRSSISLFAKSNQNLNADIDSPKKETRNRKSPPIKWIACTSTKEVNRAIEIYLHEGDIVAELGSQLRETSANICETIGETGRALLFDVERKYPKAKLKRPERTTAMRREGDEKDFFRDRARFVEMPTFDSWRHALFFHRSDDGISFQTSKEVEQIQYDALVVDVSTVAGNDLELTCISLIREFVALNQNLENNENPCRCVIIKSGSLHELARQLFHAQRIFSGAASLSSNPHHTSIIGTVGVEEYRRTIPITVSRGDVVIEVGSHFGTSTEILHHAAKAYDSDVIDLSQGGCIGVDVGDKIIAGAKKRFPHVPFVVGDAWKMSKLMQMKHEFCSITPTSNHYDVVYVDIGGLSGSEGLLEALSLLQSITNSLEPRCIVIKSVCIRRLASSLVPFSQVWKEKRMILKSQQQQ
mmetsp:Transcript_8655/g.9982  ORF Transcript_8655/g.9982 Transcript_8655/m.9982 type:complete len:454 (+) Transcript_8655:327-1688(+)